MPKWAEIYVKKKKREKKKKERKEKNLKDSGKPVQLTLVSLI